MVSRAGASARRRTPLPDGLYIAVGIFVSAVVGILLSGCGDVEPPRAVPAFALDSGNYRHLAVETHSRDCFPFVDGVPEEGEATQIIVVDPMVRLNGVELMRVGNDVGAEYEDTFPTSTGQGEEYNAAGCTLMQRISLYGTIPGENNLVVSVENSIYGVGAPCDGFGIDLPCSDTWFMQLQRTGDLPPNAGRPSPAPPDEPEVVGILTR